MKKALYPIVLIILLFSCKEDDSVTCITCDSPQTTAFQVCKESDGNASVNGESTSTNYEIYLANLINTGVSCGN